MKTMLLSLLTLCSIGLHADNTTKKYLEILDKKVSNCDRYVAAKEHRIDSLKHLLTHTDDYVERYDYSWKLYEEYRPYQLDSAGAYLKRAEVLAKEQHDSLRIIRAHLNFSPIFFQSGLYHPALDLLSDWRQRSLNATLDLRMEYFRQCVNIYSSMLNNKIEPYNKDLFMRRLRSARDSILAYEPDDWSLQAERLAYKRDFDGAISIYHRHIKDTDNDEAAALTFYGMANIYGQMGDRENQEKYLALSAINDLEHGARNYRSLSNLALMLYDDGDVARAMRYIHKCLEDAVESKAGLRAVESQKVYDLISQSHDRQEKYIRALYNGMLLLAFVFLAMLFLGIIFLRRKNRLLKRMHGELEAKNTELAMVSEKRRDTVKGFVNLSQTYLYKMEDYRKTLNKVAAKRNFDELYNAVKSSRYINEDIEDFYALFDKNFLNIYPNFVNEVNRLLRPEEQIVLEEGQQLNTELRLLVLMRYGITDSDEVAKFLRCSHSTVYNYRTKMRNRAIDREHFEENVMRITY